MTAVGGVGSGRGFFAVDWSSSGSLSREKEELERRICERGRFCALVTGVSSSSASESDSGSA